MRIRGLSSYRGVTGNTFFTDSGTEPLIPRLEGTGTVDLDVVKGVRGSVCRSEERFGDTETSPTRTVGLLKGRLELEDT